MMRSPITRTKSHALQSWMLRGGLRDIPLEEVVIPERMLRRNFNLITLTGYLVPDHDMANVFTKAMAEAAKKDPPFSPFVAPKPHTAPWVIPLQSHERATKFWKENNAHTKMVLIR